jgi:hypothetical protein
MKETPSAGGAPSMFSVVGLTLEDISTGSLPQVRLAQAMEARRKHHSSRGQPTKRIAVYTTNGTDTQALIARTKYKDRGAFYVFLYFSEGAVEACKDLGIPLHILDSLEEKELPANRQIILEDSAPAPVPR